jgi:phage-related protein
MQEMGGQTQAVYYRDRHRKEPVNAFLDDLARAKPKEAAKIDHYVERYLNGKAPSAPPPNFPISSHVQGEMRELRIRFANTRYRLLYQRSEKLVVLLHLVEKKTGKLPAADREIALKRSKDFRERMNASPCVPPRAAGHDAPPKSRGGR